MTSVFSLKNLQFHLKIMNFFDANPDQAKTSTEHRDRHFKPY